MEVCGTHTHEIFRLGIRKLLPEQVELISGPGCPVCVTPVSFIDEAIYLALEKRVTICTFGDLVRVPGHGGPGHRGHGPQGGLHSGGGCMQRPAVSGRGPAIEKRQRLSLQNTQIQALSFLF